MNNVAILIPSGCSMMFTAVVYKKTSEISTKAHLIHPFDRKRHGDGRRSHQGQHACRICAALRLYVCFEENRDQKTYGL